MMISQRLKTELPLKLWLTLGLNVWVCVPYYTLQHHQFFPISIVPRTALDALVPFNPHAVWLYVSLYLLMPFGPLLMVRREQLVRYAIGMAIISACATVIFLFWPTLCERSESTHFMYSALIWLDQPLNAFPSLHAAFAIYSGLCTMTVLKEMRASPVAQTCIWIWVALILYGTLATRQHVLVDLLSGSFLGVVVFALLFTPLLQLRSLKPPLTVPLPK